jgi:hypothetical protein
MEDSFKGTNSFMLRLERDLDKANKNNAELSLKISQTINRLDSNIKQAGIIYIRIHYIFFLSKRNVITINSL